MIISDSSRLWSSYSSSCATSEEISRQSTSSSLQSFTRSYWFTRTRDSTTLLLDSSYSSNKYAMPSSPEPTNTSTKPRLPLLYPAEMSKLLKSVKNSRLPSTSAPNSRMSTLSTKRKLEDLGKLPIMLSSLDWIRTLSVATKFYN